MSGGIEPPSAIGWIDVKLGYNNGNTYRKVASSNTSHLEAHAGFFRLLMKGFLSLCTVTF